MAQTSSRPLTSVPEACIYDEQLDHVIVITKNAVLTHVRGTQQFTDEAASSLYHMLGAALNDMRIIREARARHAC